MNIRGLSNIFTPVFSKANRREETSGADRDRENGNGAEGGSQQQRKMNQDEVLELLKKVRELPGFKDQSLSVRLEDSNGVRVIWIEDPTGKVIRRIPEAQFSSLLTSMPNKPGQILNTAA